MLWTIAQREFLDQFMSARFAIGLILAVSVTLGVTVIATQDYEQRLRDYNTAPKALEISWIHPMVFHRPSPFSILSRGDEVRLGNRVDISIYSIPLRPTSYSSRSDQAPSSGTETWPMDFTFVVKVILSLQVLFLMYDAVAGENERGTLPLILAGSVGRTTFLTAKLVGGLISAFVVLLVCALVATLVMTQSWAVEWSAEGMARLAAIFGASYLCLAAYCAIGLVISTAFRRSSSALLVAILVWAGAIGLLPGLSIELARLTAPLPSPETIARRQAAAQEPIREEQEKTEKAFGEAVRKGAVPEELNVRNHDLRIKSVWLEWQITREYQNEMSRQRRAAMMLMALSPSAALDIASSALAGTDVNSVEYFMEFARAYREEFGQFLRRQKTDRKNWSVKQMPKFQERAEPLVNAAGRVTGFLVVPVVLFGGCFLAARRTFLRYEVRRE